MEKKWISLYVENRTGVLAKVAGLFSGKAYNLDSLTVGPTEDETISRMTIGVISDDVTFEQIKKQLNRCVEVIKVIDFTENFIHKEELLFIKVRGCSREDKNELFQIAQVFQASIIDCCETSVIIKCVQTETKNNELVQLINKTYKDIEVVRGGSVAIESLSMSNR
ncbi:MAG: acetolactate synthase small subunit [Lachnospiraceae bacterium]|jgi:acetolactate synthase-1/3 small subunit|nr:acetolactate synthase small subunit [Lachnospiraceae bacterium]